MERAAAPTKSVTAPTATREDAFGRPMRARARSDVGERRLGMPLDASSAETPDSSGLPGGGDHLKGLWCMVE
jgi:hypothetical protein